jgi:D-alanyl-D-alanine dipeptidase
MAKGAGGYVVELSPSQHSSGRSVDLMILGRDGKFTR